MNAFKGTINLKIPPSWAMVGMNLSIIERLKT
jgi:hypothetical protein